MNRRNNMKRRIGLLMGILALSLGLSACESRVPLEVRVNQQSNGRQITLQRGQELIVELPREANSPYAWLVTGKGEQVLSTATKQVLKLQGQASTTERFIFVAMRKGSDQLQIDQVKVDRSDDGAQKTFKLSITVDN